LRGLIRGVASESGLDASLPLNDASLKSRHPLISALSRLLLTLAALIAAAWTAGAVWFQFSSPAHWILIGLVAAAAIAICVLALRNRRAGWIALVLSGGLVAVWWVSIAPSNDRDWASDVARGVTAEINGDDVTVHNIRNFDWRSDSDYTQRWTTRAYKLSAITTVDLVSSVWDSPAIAHTMLSFGFADGRHLVFSAEIRKKKNEAFSEIGGFFKQFELVLIAADENDILRVRTNVRGESVSLFPVRLPQDKMRALFLSYLEKGNDLAREPEFYQTITANCTTVIFKLARLIEPGMPMDWRILVSGYVPDYLYEHGALLSSLPLGDVKRQAAISRRAQGASVDDYSAVIRRPMP
jgi:hypothetical protein